MTVLADTSIWVEYLRGDRAELDALLDDGSVVVCGPVLAELLKGTEPTERSELWGSIGTLPWADLDRLGWRIVGEAAGDLRRLGVSVPLTDVAIAAAAIRADAALWTRDLDFDRVRMVLPGLQLYGSPTG